MDAELVALLGRRLKICREVAAYKRQTGIPMMQSGRVQQVKERARLLAATHGIDEDFILAIYDQIIGEACRLEDRIIDAKSPETSDQPSSK
jgi:chorismate mutase